MNFVFSQRIAISINICFANSKLKTKIIIYVSPPCTNFFVPLSAQRKKFGSENFCDNFPLLRAEIVKMVPCKNQSNPISGTDC